MQPIQIYWFSRKAFCTSANKFTSFNFLFYEIILLLISKTCHNFLRHLVYPEEKSLLAYKTGLVYNR